MNKTFIPPIKSQGIKSKLVSWIQECTNSLNFDTWIEPFMGTGVVAFNIQPSRAILGDSNPHLVNFYNALKNKEISYTIVRKFLTLEGEKLLKSNGTYYYEVRSRFNEEKSPLDFLFLSRSCFNGMMRFNKKGGYNVPFCKKPNRFAQALVTKISNQTKLISEIIDRGNYTFVNQDFSQTLANVSSNDIIYADPPYLGRNVDYFDSWDEQNERDLHELMNKSCAKFILSTWLKNKYRTNDNVFDIWSECEISIKEHFYHLGGKESNRNAVYEALLSNVKLPSSISNNEMSLKIESISNDFKKKNPIVQTSFFDE